MKDGEPFSDSSDAPTRQKNITKDHAIVGTLQYMAPEQLEGKTADARTDIFAFGEVLYEMVTGNKAFEGGSQASLIAAILDAEPPAISNLQPVTPPMLERVVKKCLAKDPEDRWHSAHDLRDELTWIAERGSLPTGPTGTSEREHWRQGNTIGARHLGSGRYPHRCCRVEFQTVATTTPSRTVCGHDATGRIVATDWFSDGRGAFA